VFEKHVVELDCVVGCMVNAQKKKRVSALFF
jgi:hypothetical protein